MLVDSSGWLLSVNYDEPHPERFFYPPSQVHSPNHQMVDIIEKEYGEFGGQALGVGYYSTRNDLWEPDARMITVGRNS